MKKLMLIIGDFLLMHTPVAPKHHITRDLGEAAYMYLRGAKLVGVTPVLNARNVRINQYTFTHRRMARLVYDFNSHRPFRFSPKRFLELRHNLKYNPPIEV